MPHGYFSGYTEGPTRSPIDALLAKFDRDVEVLQHLLFSEKDEPPAYSPIEEEMAQQILDRGLDTFKYGSKEVVLALYYVSPEMPDTDELRALSAADKLAGAVFNRSVNKFYNDEYGTDYELWPNMTEDEIEVAEAYIEQESDDIGLHDIHRAARFIHGLLKLSPPVTDDGPVVVTRYDGNLRPTVIERQTPTVAEPPTTPEVFYEKLFTTDSLPQTFAAATRALGRRIIFHAQNVFTGRGERQ